MQNQTELSDPKSREVDRHPGTAYDLTLDEAKDFAVSSGLPAFRGKQLFNWLYQQLETDYQAMTVFPIDLRTILPEILPLDPLRLVREFEADQGATIKSLHKTRDGRLVETVLMFYRDRVTVCVSCQVGCAVGCSFCATGIGGLERNLTAGEMVSQLVHAQRLARQRGRDVNNVVMMGMGEPFHNYVQTMKFVGIINDPAGLGLGARRITISTSGIVPFVERLAREPWQVNLAVSIHAPNDTLRDQLVPINRRWPIRDLMAACDRYVDITHRRISYEYALMKGINDSPAIAEQLAALLKGRLCHVNIIPLNPVDILPYERPSKADIYKFAAVLEASGIPSSVRYSRGLEIAAACGQLRANAQDVGNGMRVAR